MGNTFRKMFDSLFGSREMRVVMLGENEGAVCAGKPQGPLAAPLSACDCPWEGQEGDDRGAKRRGTPHGHAPPPSPDRRLGVPPALPPRFCAQA
jgi:hypothetical protein